MEPTRRFWTTAGIAAVLLGGAVLFQRPILLVGSAGVGAWLLARQYLFVRAVTRLDEGLTVEQAVAPERVETGEDVRVTLTATLADATPLTVRVTAAPPIQATGSTAADRTIDLDPGDRTARTTFAVRIPVAGSFEFDPPSVTVADRAGLFRQRLARGSTPPPTLTVEPRAPRNVHVGEGGEEIAVAFGEHRAGRLGAGLEPAEIREYVAGDAANRIDWKATARLDHPHVREYEAETDRKTLLLVDHRAAMREGQAGKTKLDYAREVALAFLHSARELDDPLGMYTVGDEGPTGRDPPETGPEQYAELRRRLLELAPTEGVRTADGARDEDLDDTDDPRRPTAGRAGTVGTLGTARTRRRRRPPAAARTAASRLDGDTAFGAALRPFFAATDTYVERIEADPLFGTVKTALTRQRGSLWTVVVTDDTNRSELRETVKYARRGDDSVLVFLTPSVLFEPGGLSDLEAAYERYLEFEEYRRSLARLDRVAAFEVGPGDRIGAILDAGRDDRQRRRVRT